MAIGSLRLARNKVLVRRTAVLETLGGATILCVDKTGTLTENRMTVAALWVDGDLHEVEGRRISRMRPRICSQRQHLRLPFGHPIRWIAQFAI